MYCLGENRGDRWGGETIVLKVKRRWAEDDNQEGIAEAGRKKDGKG